MSEDLVTIYVNDEALQAPAGSMLIEATDKAGITVPRFCYHKQLSVAANCRMCLVEVERFPKPMPACATPVADGMKVWTRSEKTRDAQQAIMEFLLINHPLDCPICDQGGECELQDHAMGFGKSQSEYAEIKRVVADKDIGPLIETCMTRCIQCTRCVRFGEEIAGLRELGGFGRGDRLEIGTYIEKSMRSELSGNVIDLCPVGALTAKPSRYKARAWEMKAYDSLATHDCVGSHTQIHVSRNEVVRVVPRENEAINESWLSDCDRFSYQGLYSKDRLTKPMLKYKGEWREVSWQEALDTTINALQQIDSESTAAFASANSSTEELFLFQKLCTHLHIDNLDHRLRQVDFSDQTSDPITPWLGMKLVDLEQQEAFLLIGANPRQDQPLLNHRIRKAVQQDADVIAINPYEVDFNYPVKQHVFAPSQLVPTLAACAAYLAEAHSFPVNKQLQLLLTGITITPKAEQLGKKLAQLANKKAAILLGNMAYQQLSFAPLRALCIALSEWLNIRLAYMPEQSNTVGAYLTGVLPHRHEWGEAKTQHGLAFAQALQSSPKTFFLMNVEPSYDSNNPAHFNEVLQSAEQVIAISAYASQDLLESATILLPSALPLETSGTYINTELKWQSTKGVIAPPEETRPAWKILRVLGSRIGVPNFDYLNSQEVMADFKYSEFARLNSELTLDYDWNTPIRFHGDDGELQRIGYVPMYRCDAQVRRSEALQEAQTIVDEVVIHPDTATALELSTGDEVHATQGTASVQLPIRLDHRIPKRGVLIPSATEVSAKLGGAFAAIQLTKVTP